MIENLDFELLLKCLKNKSTFVDSEIKMLFDAEKLSEVQKVLNILIDIDLIKNYELSTDWTLKIIS